MAPHLSTNKNVEISVTMLTASETSHNKPRGGGVRDATREWENQNIDNSWRWRSEPTTSSKSTWKNLTLLITKTSELAEVIRPKYPWRMGAEVVHVEMHVEHVGAEAERGGEMFAIKFRLRLDRSRTYRLWWASDVPQASFKSPLSSKPVRLNRKVVAEIATCNVVMVEG